MDTYWQPSWFEDLNSDDYEPTPPGPVELARVTGLNLRTLIDVYRSCETDDDWEEYVNMVLN